MLDELTKIGLSSNEARTYLALLELGSATAQEIARKSGIKRATTYVQLESLSKIGLVTSFEKAPERKNGASKTYFRAEDPQYLSKILEREKKLASDRERVLSSLLPELAKVYLSSGERPRVRFFDGVEGLRTMQDQFLKSGVESVDSFSSADDVLKIFPNLAEEYTIRKAKKAIKSKVIYTSSKGPFLKPYDETNLREARYVSSEKFPLSCDVAIYGNTVAISVLKNKIFGVAVENKEIADSMRSFFALAWSATNNA